MFIVHCTYYIICVVLWYVIQPPPSYSVPYNTTVLYPNTPQNLPLHTLNSLDWETDLNKYLHTQHKNI